MSFVLAVLLCVAAAMLSGCAARRMKTDYKGFENAFAETSNHEVLLNLARLQNRDPTYFFKLGQITSSYRMQASLTGSGNYVSPPFAAGNKVTGGGSPGLLYENDPVFTFIPVNDETNAQVLLNPVPAETFYVLYQQGWRLDQLMRLMVDRIEYFRPAPYKDVPCIVETIRNQAPSAHSRNVEPDPDSLSEYVTFLRISAVAYELQKHGYLRLQGSERKFVPYDRQTVVDPGSSATTPPKAEDIAKAASSNAAWELGSDNKWRYGQLIPTAKFVLNPPPADPAARPGALDSIQAIKAELSKIHELGELGAGEALDHTLRAISQGFSIETGNNAQATLPGQDKSGSASDHACNEPPHLIMRSLLSVMSAAAQEQNAFDDLMKSSRLIPQSRYEKASAYTPQTFSSSVPELEQIPTLRITWTAADKGTSPLVQVDYRGKQYFIADSTAPETAPENEYWNRDMFRLISQLQAQVTVDISKFPLPAVLQLNTQ